MRFLMTGQYNLYLELDRTVCEILRRIGRKYAFFRQFYSLHFLFGALAKGVPLGYERLPDDESRMIIHSFASTKYQLVTD